MTVLYLVFPALFGYLGYREARTFAAQHGRAPWGLPPWVWGVFTATSLLIGGVLLAIARRTTGPATPPPGVPPTAVPPATGPTLARTVLPGG
ncbi:MAG TPA: hypothetical protein VFR07_17975 [Mycobacteriales bacterium]|jgi:hypothetical protein|nr:hypothetical protein [Mycobacteriales bacterium]